VGKKEVPGIRIEYRKPNHCIYDMLNVSFTVGKGIPSEDFISTPQIRQAISEYAKRLKNPQSFKRYIGFVTLKFSEGEKTVEWVYSHHFSNAPNGIFNHKGIASKLDLIVIREMKKRHPQLEFVNLGSSKAVKHLGKAGISKTKPCSYREAVRKLEIKIFWNDIKKTEIPRTLIKLFKRKPPIVIKLVNRIIRKKMR